MGKEIKYSFYQKIILGDQLIKNGTITTPEEYLKLMSDDKFLATFLPKKRSLKVKLP